MKRSTFFHSLAAGIAGGICLLQQPQTVSALIPPSQQGTGSSPVSDLMENAPTSTTIKTIAYQSLSLPIEEFGVKVPVACWYPGGNNNDDDNFGQGKGVKYNHRISVKRIGELLAGWNFIPAFASRDFQLDPMMSSLSSSSVITNGGNIPFPSEAPVIFLAHGFLGSRFDLSHIAEALAEEGFVCISPEYPESLAASYPRCEGLDRSVITSRLIKSVTEDWNLRPTSYGIVGHSLGCGTAIRTGDENWTRVIIAGPPYRNDGSSIPGSVLFVASTNDGLARMSGFSSKMIKSDYSLLDENTITISEESSSSIPSRAALVFERSDGPNHISFLTEGVNNAMIDLLAPLLPIAQTMSIPVLDFDKYMDSRDSKQTARIVNPLVVNFMKQQMQQSS